ncbi:RNA polymerase sigma factor, partial [Phocaeicola sartorii]
MINEDKIREVCASHPERGFKLLMDHFQQPIYWHIRRLVVSHEDAEDILQEVFIRIFRHLPQFREESSLGTW